MEALIRRMYKQSNPLGPQVCPKYSVSVTFSPTLFHIVEIVHVILTVSRQHPPAAVLASGVDISSSMGVDISSFYWSWYLQFYWSWYLQFYWSWYLQVLLELISPGSTRVNISRFYWSWYHQVLLELISPGFTGVDISRFYWSWYLQVLLELRYLGYYYILQAQSFHFILNPEIMRRMYIWNVDSSNCSGMQGQSEQKLTNLCKIKNDNKNL